MFALTRQARTLSSVANAGLIRSLAPASQRVVSLRPQFKLLVPQTSSFLRALSTSRVFQQETKVFVANLPYGLTESDIGEIVAPFEPSSMRMGKDHQGRPAGFAHINFPSLQQATNFMSACEAREVSFGDRIPRVDFAHQNATGTPKEPTSTLFVGNIAYETTEEDIREVFEQYGDVLRINLAKDPTGQPRGFAHVQFSTVDAARSAHSSQLSILGRDLNLDFAAGRTVQQAQPYHKLYFSDFNGDESSLRHVMGEFEGKAASIFFLRDRATNQYTGSGFIDFVNVDIATAALHALNGVAVEGNGDTGLKLSYAKPPRNDLAGGRDFGRDGGRGGGRDGGRDGGRGARRY